MREIPSFISPLIESQFPAFYKEEGPEFIRFVQTYYEWLEQEGNPLYMSRNLLNIRDIDDTSDDFILYFKEQILKNIQFNTASNQRLFIKNALDFYRSKGSKRSIDLFFKLVYGVPAEVQYPAENLFKLSDNKWKEPIYLELSNSPLNPTYEDKQIVGLESNATAFVEGYTTKKIINNFFDTSGLPVRVSKLINILYITDLTADFKTGERIIHNEITEPDKAPTVIGSLSSLVVAAGGSEYNIGDIVTLESETGINGKAVVSGIENATGQVSFTLIDGGWGYTLSPEILIAEKTIILEDIQTYDRNTPSVFKIFENVYQDIGYVSVNNVENPSEIFQFTLGNIEETTFTIFDDSPTPVAVANCGIIGVESDSPYTSANIYFYVISGNTLAEIISTPVPNDQWYLENSVTQQKLANVESGNAFIDKYAYARFIGSSDESTMQVNGPSGLLVDEVIQQKNNLRTWGEAQIVSITQGDGDLFELKLNNFNGTFIQDLSVKVVTLTFGQENIFQDPDANRFFIETSDTSVDFTIFEVGDVLTISGSTNNDGNYTVIDVESISKFYIQEEIQTGSDGSTVTITTDFKIVGRSSGTEVKLNNYDLTIGVNGTSLTSVIDVNIVNGGNDYTQADLNTFLTFTSDELNVGSGAAAYISEVNNGSGSGAITGITVIRNGIGYTTAPSVSVSGTAGSGAVFTAVLGNAPEYSRQGIILKGNTSNSRGTMKGVTLGSLAGFKVGSLDDIVYDIRVFTDLIAGYNAFGQDYVNLDTPLLSVPLQDNSGDPSSLGAFGFPKNPSANLSIKIVSSHTDKSITSIVGDGSIITVNASGHGLSNGELIEIDGADTYNGIYNVYQTGDGGGGSVSDFFRLADPWDAPRGSLNTGTVASLYTDDLTFNGKTITSSTINFTQFFDDPTIQGNPINYLYIHGSRYNNRFASRVTARTATSVTIDDANFVGGSNTATVNITNLVGTQITPTSYVYECTTSPAAHNFNWGDTVFIKGRNDDQDGNHVVQEVVDDYTFKYFTENNTGSGSGGNVGLAPPIIYRYNGEVLEDILSYEDLNLGTIATLSSINPGEDYNISPITTIYEPYSYAVQKKDYEITTVNPVIGFSLNERLIVTSITEFNPSQVDSNLNAIIFTSNPYTDGTTLTYTTTAVDGSNNPAPIDGLANEGVYTVINSTLTSFQLSENGIDAINIQSPGPFTGHFFSVNNGYIFARIYEKISQYVLRARRLTLSDISSGWTKLFITGENSGYKSEVFKINPLNFLTNTSGINAEVDTDVVTANGVVTSLRVLDSGFGYTQGSSVTFSRDGATAGIAIPQIEKQGKGQGFHLSTKSYLGSDKYLHDGDYYQEFSYVIDSAIPFDQYFEMLKKVLHLAGTKMFPSTSVETTANFSGEASMVHEREVVFDIQGDVNSDLNLIIIENHNYADQTELLYIADDDIYDAETLPLDGLTYNETYILNANNAPITDFVITNGGGTTYTVTTPAHYYKNGYKFKLYNFTDALDDTVFIVVNSGTTTFDFVGPDISSVQLNISNAEWADNIATITVTDHSFSDGDSVIISNANPSDYNGTYEITVIDENTFSYPLTLGSNPSVYSGSGTVYKTQGLSSTISLINNYSFNLLDTETKNIMDITAATAPNSHFLTNIITN